MPDLSRAFVPIRTILDDIWMFDNRDPQFQVERGLTALLFALFIWNSISYSPIVCLFMVQCCNLQLLWMIYKWNKGLKRGASDEQISKLPRWRYKEAGNKKNRNSLPTYEVECCICLAMYKKNEKIRQLPCSHIFHLPCVDKWLKTRSICPICSQDLGGKKIN